MFFETSQFIITKNLCYYFIRCFSGNKKPGIRTGLGDVVVIELLLPLSTEHTMKIRAAKKNFLSIISYLLCWSPIHNYGKSDYANKKKE